ncbi:probable ubiquitin-conjugating enzyme E2 24 [Macadamia integrifolia]|uniref:probable ubiquitin-conjugating enzyme E2 24 n=1 Tax=Macadamia integrifolia TaxID=60698 RepID=UPI001C4FE550|nr:probable ubiquitin-conjugating enzyme E2 24 [Macadamia integrifolia]
MDMLHSDTDCESFGLSSGSEDQDDIDSYGGQAQSIFSSLEDSIGKIDDFLAFERGFVHGDIVCSMTDPSGQMGRVVDVDVVVDLENFFGEIIKDVNSKKLLKIRNFTLGDYVVHGPWLGKVGRVVDRVTILFDDGAKCEVTTADPVNLIPMSSNLLEDAQYPYYPGQLVRVRHSSFFKSARWLCGVWKENRVEGTVCHVEAGLVYIDWVAYANIGSDINFPAPPCKQDSRNLTLLSCFPYANWQLGDWCVLPVDVQRLVNKHVSPTFSFQGCKKIEGQQRSFPDSHFEETYIIMKRKIKVDVLWQDGSHSSGLDSQLLFPVFNVGDHEFWPEQFVQEKMTYDDPHVSSCQRLGVVKSVDAKERTVKVKWRTPVVNQTAYSVKDYNEETVSAYELIEHPDYCYCFGDVVFRLEKNRYAFETDGKNETHEDYLETEAGVDFAPVFGDSALEHKHSGQGQQEDPHKYYLSCIGTVIGSKDGSIEVKWASGHISKVEPHEIVGIDKYEESDANPVHNEEIIEGDLSQENPGYGKQSWKLKEKDVLEKTSNVIDKECKKDVWDSGAFFLPRAAIDFFTNVVASLFGSHGSTSEDVNKFYHTHEIEVFEHCKINTEEPPSVGYDMKTFRQTSLKQKIEEQESKELFSSGNEKQGLFKAFDIVVDSSDHHFVNESGDGSMLSQAKRGWLRKVQQEWTILQRDLPDTIYIRVYEERIDLLRAAIVGAPGTPYHDGLFFFDFLLPPDYPHEPPLVHYRSGGLCLNPNLYESGKVCLSLLNTWTGTGTEVWNPGSSSILQVLLSLQALVLNDKPYFNEAGYDEQKGKAEGEKNSITYNENAFLLSCKSMLYLLRNPPKNFEALVEEHFRRHSHLILLACKAYMEGALVGCAFGCGMTDQECQKSSSTGFKIMLAKLFPKLVQSFAAKGIDCSQFIETENGFVIK